MSYDNSKVTIVHRMMIVEDEILNFLRKQKPEKPAYQRTLQQFFEYVAKTQEIETERERKRNGKIRKDKQVSEEDKTDIMNDYIRRREEPGIKTKLANEYGVSHHMIYKITQFI